MTGELILERRDRVAIATLNRPQKRNALSIALREEIAERFRALGEDPEVGCVVLTGAGSAFCSGMDVDQFGGDLAHRRRLVETSGLAFAAVMRCELPVIAALNGPALAGGFALALLCDLRIAAESASLGYPELPRGIPPSYAAARAALPEAAAAELCLTGRTLDASEARELGVVGDVVADDILLDRACELGERIAALPRSATRETKRRIVLARERAWGFLFEEERRVFKQALLGDPDDRA